MPFRKGVVRAAGLSLLGAGFIATAIVYTWQWTHSSRWTLVASAVAGGILKGLETQRKHRRNMLPIHVRYPGSTAV